MMMNIQILDVQQNSRPCDFLKKKKKRISHEPSIDIGEKKKIM